MFYQAQVFEGIDWFQIKKLNIKNELRKTKDFYIGSSAEKITCKLHKEKMTY